MIFHVVGTQSYKKQHGCTLCYEEVCLYYMRSLERKHFVYG